MKNNKKGFTLIELLVSILIMAILAAISFPIYYPAILKAKLLNGAAIIKEIASANDRYYMIHDKYTNKFQYLDVEFAMTWDKADTDDGEMLCNPSCANPKMWYDMSDTRSQYTFYRGSQQIGIGINYSINKNGANKLYCFYTASTGEDAKLGKIVCNSSGFNVQDTDYEDGERWFLVN